MSIPALRELRRIFPDARITLHAKAWADGLFQDASFIDELVTYEKSRWVLKDIYRNSEFLKDDGYDLAVIMPNSLESAITALISRIPRRIGYNKDARGLLLTDPVPVPEWKNRRHEVFYYLNLIAQVEKRVLGRETVSTAWPDGRLEVSNERKQAARDRLEAAGIDLSLKTVSLGMGSTNGPARRWPIERYVDLAGRLISEYNANILLMGSEAESSLADEIVAGCGGRPVDLTRGVGVGEAAALLSVSDLMIANDMGLGHVAAAVGTDTITICGPTNPETTRPFAEHALVIRKQVECSPCLLRECPIDHRCMTQVSVDEVFTAAAMRLDPHDADDLA